MEITAKIINAIIDELQNVSTIEESRKVFFSAVSLSDIVPLKYTETIKQIVFRRLYDKTGKGYKGVVNEVNKRLDTIEFTEKIISMGGIPVREFFLHKQGETDTIDFDNHVGYEEKSGCGDWLKSHDFSTFDEIVKAYRRKRTLIRWDYSFTVETKKAGKENFHIEIVSTYAELFDFLSDFQGGFQTWWKENGRSGKTGLYIWELQTINTSRKKALYLTTWDAWKADRKK